MLYRITANKDSFRPVEFKEGLNVVLAEKGASSGKNNTRNGVGKTTLVEILMFCLGGHASKGKGIMQSALQSWKFTLEMSLKGSRVKVTRSVAEPNRIWVEGNVGSWKIQPDFTELTGTHAYEIARWQDLIGWALFDLDPSVKTQNTHPVSKGLLSCFIRNGQQAYRGIDSHGLTGTEGKEKTNLAHLLRLDWEFIGRIKELHNSLKDLRATNRSVEAGAFSQVSGNIDEIRVEQGRIQAEITKLERDLTTFNFSAEYNRLQDNLNELTRDTLSLSNRIAANNHKLSIIRTAIKEEEDASPEAIEALYKEVGLAFPESLRKTLEEVQAFHRQIVVNRKNFLASELARLSNDIQTMTKTRDEKSKRKGELTAELEAQDIYSELTKHRERLAELNSQDKRHEEWLADLERLDQNIDGLEKQIEEVRSNAVRDFMERRRVLDSISADFSSLTFELYGKRGMLSIVPEKDDYSLSVEMEKRGSDGVRQMGIFCFDLALLKAQNHFGREISFLVHDTPIFDAADDRQRAKALEIAARETGEINCQYICVINSDKVPRSDFTDLFNFDSHVIHRLSDATPADSLLGIHFEVDA